MKYKSVVVILAGGSGERFKSEIPKQFFKVGGKTIIEHTIEIFEEYNNIDDICIVVNPNFKEQLKTILKRNNYKKIISVLDGGKTRQESSRIALFALKNNNYKYILTHDAIRPLLSTEIIDRILEALKRYKSVDVAIPTADTIIKVDENMIIKDIPNRKYIMRGQTPQGFDFNTLLKAHQIALNEGFESSPDDCYLVLRYNLADTYVVVGSEDNIKITYQIDIHLLDKLLQLKSRTFSNIKIKDIKSKLKNKVLVIFGATKGIGKSIYEISKKLCAKPYGFGSETDIRNPDNIKKVLENIHAKNGKIDAVIITAGIMKTENLENISFSDIYDQIDINLKGTILVSKLSIPFLKETQGHLVMFASSSYTLGRENYTIYSATKAAVVNFMQGLSQEMIEYNIKVNAINPERTLTPMRIKNFKNEDRSLLLNSDFVALHTLNLLQTNITGSVIDIRKSMEKDKIISEIQNLLRN